MQHFKIKSSLFLPALVMVLVAWSPVTDFLAEQKKFERVRTAVSEKQQSVVKILQGNDLQTDNFSLLMIAYKDIGKLELYAKKKQTSEYKKIAVYDICAKSGSLGPKRKIGDYQVPEGYYHIDRFNPASNYYLSLGINYPNRSDRLKSKAANLGGDIFIHGSCVTIGCLPMTDDKIKEIYLLAVHAKNNGQSKIPVYIYPFKMSDANMANYLEKYKSNAALLDFWRTLKPGYDKFMNGKKELNVSVDERGDYGY